MTDCTHREACIHGCVKSVACNPGRTGVYVYIYIYTHTHTHKHTHVTLVYITLASFAYIVIFLTHSQLWRGLHLWARRQLRTPRQGCACQPCHHCPVELWQGVPCSQEILHVRLRVCAYGPQLTHAWSCAGTLDRDSAVL
jgi:hypothetical protein